MVVSPDYGVKVVARNCFLGCVIGGQSTYYMQFVREKVDVWLECMDKWSAINASQVAYTSLTKSLQCEWDFHLRLY